jgi:ATP-dependent DNA ligase
MTGRTGFRRSQPQPRALGVGTAILDGEAVVLDEQGRSDFGALQQSLGGRGGKRASTESILYAFDLLYFDGHDLTGTELSVRRHLLEDLLDGAGGAIQLSEEVSGDGAEASEECLHRSGWKVSSPNSATAHIGRAEPATG